MVIRILSTIYSSLQVLEETSVIVLNSIELVISDASVTIENSTR